MGFDELDEAGRCQRQAERDERERLRVLLDHHDAPAAGLLFPLLFAVPCFVLAYVGWKTGVQGSLLFAAVGIGVVWVARWLRK